MPPNIPHPHHTHHHTRASHLHRGHLRRSLYKSLRTGIHTHINIGTRTRVTPILTATLATLLSLTACQNVAPAFGPTTTAARANANSLFTAFTQRFTNVSRTPRYAKAREVIGRYALTPSVIYNDTSIWTSITTDGTHTLFGDASFANDRYTFTNALNSDPLNTLADGRHIMRLRKVGEDEYEWFTGVDFAAGSITASDVGNVVTSWLAAAEGHSAAAIQADYREAFPHTTTALGKLFTLDTLISVRDKDGGNTVYMIIRLTPDNIRPTLPHYAAYLDKYIKRLKLRFILTDASGAKWFDAAAQSGIFTIRLRSHDGHFAPLEGAIRPIPDTLTLHLDMSAKLSVFTVGVSKLTGEWVNVQSSHERGWAIRFTHEPDWQLPPIVGHLIRSSLQRPFQGEGTQFRITIHDTPGEQTLLSRRGLLTVQEGGILRFLGKLGGAAMGDFVATAEEEENRFDASIFSALNTDIATLLK